MSIKNLKLIVLFGIMIAVFAIASILLPDRFLTLVNFQSISSQIPEFGLLALGVMLAMLTGGIDLSVVSIASISGISAAMILTKYSAPQGSLQEYIIVFSAIAAALLVSTICGLINGLIIGYLKVLPILVTLGTSGVFMGIGVIITEGSGIVGFPESFLYIGSGKISFIPMPLIIFIVVVLIIALILNKTIFGHSVYLVGSNPIAARFSNINTISVLVRVYMVSGLLAGVASLIMISRVNSAKSYYGQAYLLQAILVSVLGGVNPAGGAGTISGLIMGIIILQLLQSLFNIFALSPFAKNIVWGLMLIIVMIINYYLVVYQQRSIRLRSLRLKNK